MATSKIPKQTVEKSVFYAAQNAYSSVALALVAMETIFDGLSLAEQANSYIVANNHAIYRCTDLASKTFSRTSFDANNVCVTNILDLNNHKYYSYSMNPNITKEDLSASVQTTTYRLRVVSP